MPRAIGEAILKNKSKYSSCEKDIFKLRLTIENHTNGFNKIRETLNSRCWVTRRSGNLSVALYNTHVGESGSIDNSLWLNNEINTTLFISWCSPYQKHVTNAWKNLCILQWARFLLLSALLLCIGMTLELRPPESCSLGL